MNALNQLLPLAVGIAVSPLPIVAVVAILLSARGRTAAPAYTGAFALVTLGFVAIGAASGGSASAAAGRTTVMLVLASLLTAGFAVLSVLSWHARPRAGAVPKTPGWLAAVDTITPVRAAGLGLLMAVTNAKNIPLELKGGALIGSAHTQPLIAAAVCVALAVVGSIGLIVPTVLAGTGSARMTRALGHVKVGLITHNAAIMTVLFAILAINEGAHVVQQVAA
ncbi:GAP family protein [Microbacterium sp. ASV49]|nr:GAP family protein [Microbacterium sp. ASV49]